MDRFLEQRTEPGCCSARTASTAPSEEVHRVLVEVVEAMREGKVISLVPRAQRLTTREAADFLGVGRLTMAKLLEDGKIPTSSQGITVGSSLPTYSTTPSGSASDTDWYAFKTTQT